MGRTGAGRGQRPQDEGEERRVPQPSIEGTPEAVRVALLCYLEKIMLLPLGDTVPGSTPWKQSAGGILAPPRPQLDALVQVVAYTTVCVNTAVAL